MKTRFHNWTIDGYKASSPDRKYVLWIANGFLSFYDHAPHYPRQTLLAGISIFQRYKIWKELCLERKRRAGDFMEDVTSMTEYERGQKDERERIVKLLGWETWNLGYTPYDSVILDGYEERLAQLMGSNKDV